MYFYTLYNGATKRYCIMRAQGRGAAVDTRLDQAISRNYVQRAALDRHVARLLARGWQWVGGEQDGN